MNAPKKIWWNSEEDKADEYSDYGTGTVSYIRADIVHELVEALEMLLRLDEEHQRGADDEDVCFEVRKARAALAKLEESHD